MDSSRKQYWRKDLPEEVMEVVKNKGTEAPFTGKYVNNYDSGMYECVVYGQQVLHQLLCPQFQKKSLRVLINILIR